MSVPKNDDILNARYNKPYADWADKLKAVLTPEEFVNFAEFIDGCDDAKFSGELAERAAKIAPEKYTYRDDEKA